jgi:hypothetical protein
MVRAQKRKKRPKGSNQFYSDDTFMPVSDAKYLRVENLYGDVKAEVRKQMNQGRAARLEARNDPTLIKPQAPEISLAAAITNVKQLHKEKTPQSSPQELKEDVIIANIKNDILASSSSQFKTTISTTPKPAILKRLPQPTYSALAPVQGPTASPMVSYRRNFVGNNFSPSPISSTYRHVSTVPTQRKMFMHSPGESPSTRYIRVIRQPVRYLSPIVKPVRSLMYVNSNGTVVRPQTNFVRRIVSYDSPRMVVQANNNISIRPGIYHQTTSNTFVQANNNNNLSSNVVFPINSTNGMEPTLSTTNRKITNGKITENGIVNEMPTLKRFDQYQGNSHEIINGCKPEDKVLSANQSSNQNC